MCRQRQDEHRAFDDRRIVPQTHAELRHLQPGERWGLPGANTRQAYMFIVRFPPLATFALGPSSTDGVHCRPCYSC